MKFFLAGTLLILINTVGLSQCNKKTIGKIHAAIINSYYLNDPPNIVVNDSTNNLTLTEIDFAKIADGIQRKNVIFFGEMKGLDSNWKCFLLEADALKSKLVSSEVHKFPVSGYSIQFESWKNLTTKLGSFGWGNFGKVYAAKDYITLSDVLGFKKRAIVAFSRQSGDLDSETRIYFLEKVNGKWKVVGYLQDSVS